MERMRAFHFHSALVIDCIRCGSLGTVCMPTPMGYANMRFATGIVDRFLHRLDTEQTLNGRACMQGG